MNIYRKRYINALKKAATVNRYQKKGYIVFFDGAPTNGRFEMWRGELLFRTSQRSTYLFYQDSKDWDHGYWTPVKEWNKAFHTRFQVYEPTAKVF